MKKYTGIVKCYKKGNSKQCSIPISIKEGLKNDDKVYIIRKDDFKDTSKDCIILENRIQEHEKTIIELNQKIKEFEGLNLDKRLNDYDELRINFDKLNNDYINEIKESKEKSDKLANAALTLTAYKDIINDWKHSNIWSRLRNKPPNSYKQLENFKNESNEFESDNEGFK
jgi:hypothetical protein